MFGEHGKRNSLAQEPRSCRTRSPRGNGIATSSRSGITNVYWFNGQVFWHKCCSNWLMFPNHHSCSFCSGTNSAPRVMRLSIMNLLPKIILALMDHTQELLLGPDSIRREATLESKSTDEVWNSLSSKHHVLLTSTCAKQSSHGHSGDRQSLNSYALWTE